jgi:hypothetical protein
MIAMSTTLVERFFGIGYIVPISLDKGIKAIKKSAFRAP